MYLYGDKNGPHDRAAEQHHVLGMRREKRHGPLRHAEFIVILTRETAGTCGHHAASRLRFRSADIARSVASANSYIRGFGQAVVPLLKQELLARMSISNLSTA